MRCPQWVESVEERERAGERERRSRATQFMSMVIEANCLDYCISISIVAFLLLVLLWGKKLLKLLSNCQVDWCVLKWVL